MAALRALRTHPRVTWCAWAYGVAELTDGGWLLSDIDQVTPQEARDSLGWWLRIQARRRSTPEALRAQYWDASAKLESAKLNHLTVAGRRFQVIRADQFCRMSVSGPEPPRATDPVFERRRPPTKGTTPQLLTGGLLPAAHPPGSAALMGERWEIVHRGRMVPPEVTRDAERALVDYPKVAMLPTRFAIVEEACRGLATYCSRIAPELLELTAHESAVYRAAAERLEHETVHQITVAGRRFRITRLATVVRVGSDGPEPPRPSDHDPEPPLTGETEALKTYGRIDD